MELALTLISIASFFALILAWVVLPATGTTAADLSQVATARPQGAH